MDLMKEFEAYLPKWSEDKHKPIPTKQHMNRWYEAWNDFVKEVLSVRWESLKDEYLSLKLKSRDYDYDYDEADSVQEEDPNIEEFEDIIPEEAGTQDEPKEEPMTEWERVQKIMDELK